MENSQKLSVLQVFKIFLRLGLTSFGGPVAHLGYFRDEFVTRCRALGDAEYADLVALCQFLPGPASSQVGIALGLSQAGLRGALAAWAGFTLPSAAAMILFGYGVTTLQGEVTHAGWLHGLKVVAVAVVALAIRGMAKTLTPDRSRASIAILAAVLVLVWSSAWGQILAILLGGLFGLLFLKTDVLYQHSALPIPLGRVSAIFCICLFAVLLVGIPILAGLVHNHTIALIDSFYRTGSLVFGGGHVVLPLLQTAVVPPGWISKDMFLAGYGAAQAVPGPLFTFSAYLGTVMQPAPNGWTGGIICLVSVYMPSFLLLIGILPFWEMIRKAVTVRRALMGVNAAVVGLLLAAFYNPVWTSGILSVSDFILGLIAFGLLSFWKVPPWLVVVATAIGSAGLAAM
ncbi:MAG TPA: chromate efflux transporter [Burkholderiales bacterium]|nr:chromate efflux transporter [Burkholderiales bacterium]